MKAIGMFIIVLAAILFFIGCQFRSPAFVSALARNTLIIFIGHMPLIYAVSPWLQQMEGFWIKRGILIAVCLVGLGLISEGLVRAVDLPALRERSRLALVRFRSAA